ncbi:hypothetical protein ZWY2020_044161 [Hordeum vulgare]|nr:hypothetical protein ZWY2020_044161 [Hordeum vulgare]
MRCEVELALGKCRVDRDDEQQSIIQGIIDSAHCDNIWESGFQNAQEAIASNVLKFLFGSKVSSIFCVGGQDTASKPGSAAKQDMSILSEDVRTDTKSSRESREHIDMNEKIKHVKSSSIHEPVKTKRAGVHDAERRRSSHKWTGRGLPVSASLLRRKTEEFNIRHGLLPAPAPPAAPAPPDSPPPECEDGSSSDTWTLSITASSPYTPAREVAVDEDGFEIYDPTAFERSVTRQDFVPEEVLATVTGAATRRSNTTPSAAAVRSTSISSYSSRASSRTSSTASRRPPRRARRGNPSSSMSTPTPTRSQCTPTTARPHPASSSELILACLGLASQM